MEKLEQILHAEETARHTVVDARERAAAIEAEAKAEAALLKQQASREATENAARIYDEALVAARADAADIDAAAAVALERDLGVAAKAKPRAVDALLTRLVD